MLLEAVTEAAEKELDADKDCGAANPLQARLETMQGALVNFEHEKEQIDDNFFDLAAGADPRGLCGGGRCQGGLREGQTS